MSGPFSRVDSRILRLLVIGTGLGWSIAFPAIALYYQLELYGDGAMFSYAVAVQDVWAFHWHNVSGRSSVFFLILLPAETMVGLTGRPFDFDVRGRSLASPIHILLRLLFDRPVVPIDLRLSNRDVARPRDILARACN